jgi:hypothetical protein
MILKVFALRDVKTASFGTPMFLITEAQAVRSVGDEVNSKDKSNNLCSHSEDFELFSLGSFDTDTAKFELESSPRSVVQCSSLVRE